MSQNTSVVNIKESAIARRSFLKAAAPCLLFAMGSGASILKSQVLAERGEFGDSDLGWVRDQLLELVNSERAAAGLSQLQLDDLASSVANKHAYDMAQAKFMGHWGSDGRKPYQRYSFAGGIDAMQENVSSAYNIASITPLRVFTDLRDMHVKMHSETPPNDGHRRAMLGPQHTHAGFGVAREGHNLRLTELYLSRYLELSPFAQQAKQKTTLSLKGKLLSSKYALHEVDIFHEPLPSAPDIAWLRTPRSYSLPEEFVPLRPKTPFPTTYTDGSKGDYEWSRSGTFRVPVKLSKDAPGIYTVLFWIKRFPEDTKFPAAQVCIRVD
ncbi:MAG: hypothetical protein JWM21_3016 [Acidobacteria bacterium]|nr:hypothetical protein [Acidobacteriota bacterium]